MIIKEAFLFLLWLKGCIHPPKFIPILNYHSLDKTGSIISTRPEDFRSQMRYLKKSGYETIPLRELVVSSSNINEPRKLIAITFDDGFKSIYTVAFPLLKELGFTATVFVTVGMIGKQWTVDKDIPEFPMLSWDEIKEMDSEGIDFGSHTLTHPHLSLLRLPDVRKEIFTSQKIIEQKLNKKINFFAYPYGDFDEKIINLVKKASFKGACSAIPHLPNTVVDPYKLPRFDINRFSKNPSSICMLFFKTCLVGTFGYYLCFKSKLLWTRKKTFEYKERSRKRNVSH